MNISDAEPTLPEPLSPFDAAPTGMRVRRPRATFVGNIALSVPIALLMVIVIGVADYVTGYEVRLGILYVVPVALATWACGRRWGLLIGVLGPLTWAASFASQHAYSRDIFFYWDCVVMATTLLLFVELLARLRTALARSDERFVRVLDGLHAAVYVTDDELEVLFANERLVRLLGNDKRVPTAAEISSRFPVTASEIHGVSDAPTNLPFTGSEARDPVDGRWYVIQQGSIPWIDRRRVRLTVMTDITEQKRAEELQREHLAALNHTARLVNLTETATTLAHELNQPLLAIVGYNAACLRLLEAGQVTAGELTAAMEKCRAQAVRAGDILQRLRELTRRRTPTLAACDLNAMIRQLLAWVQGDLAREDIGIDLRLAELLPSVSADRILVEQVVLNLIQNAIEAMHDAKPGRRLLVVGTAVESDSAVRVTVADQGVGLAPEIVGRLYAPFFTTKEKGLGLGLSICRSVVEMHGGRLWHETRPEGGTAFQFTLPKGAA